MCSGLLSDLLNFVFKDSYRNGISRLLANQLRKLLRAAMWLLRLETDLR
jgi:hypothetical protein